MRDLPRGTVTFLFTDIEGSTRLLHELGDRYAGVLAEHRRKLREAFAQHGGVEVDTQGDAFFVAFERAADAVACAAAAREALAGGRVQVRMGIHTGEPIVTDEGYVGIDVHRGARVMGAGHGGQILVSENAARLADGADLRDLGPHRLKDLTAPMRLYQLGDGTFPPLKTLDATNLPLAASPLVGRERELRDVLTALSGDARVVTITGPGGSGKTRLALQAAAESVGSYRDGVFWVPLAALTDADLVSGAISQAVGAKDDLGASLAGKEVLLLLDNFEHLMEAARELSELLAALSGTTVLVTSRAPLRIEGEHEYALDPLRSSEASALFVERARAAGRSVDADGVVSEICRRVDNLPLAVELAAARAKLFSPEALLERLERRLPVLTGGRRDAPERQRTLRATIEWSYDLLDDDVKHLFARLSVFAGTFSVDAAESVAEADLETIAALVDASLLKPVEDDRFLMLETVREYAAGRLGEETDAPVLRLRHARHFVEAASGRDLRPGPDRLRRIAELERDHDNFRAALACLRAEGEAELGLRLVSALGRLWVLKGHLDEGRAWLDDFLRAPAAGPGPDRLSALRARFRIAYQQRDLGVARATAAELVQVAEAIRDDEARVYARLAQADVAELEEDLEVAWRLNQEAIALARALGRPGVILEAVGNGISIADDLDVAAALEREFLQLADRLGDVPMSAVARMNLGWLEVRRGRRSEAARCFREAIPRLHDLDYKDALYRALGGLAAATAAVDPVRAAELLSAALAIVDSMHAALEPGSVRNTELIYAEIEEQIGREALSAARERGRGLTQAEAVEHALALD